MNAFSLVACGVDLIQAVNWLTVLDDPLIEAIGGEAKLRDLLGAAAGRIGTKAPTIYPYAGGVLIRAGEYPQLGDRDISGVPEIYRAVGTALKPLLFTEYPNKPTQLIKVPRPLDAHDETIRWVTRFSDEDYVSKAPPPHADAGRCP